MHSAAGLLVTAAEAGLTPGSSLVCTVLPPCPMRTHSGLIRFFSKRVMSQSDGTALRRSASEMADCRISRIAASSARVLHAAASKTRRYCDSKSFCGGRPPGAGISGITLSDVADWRLPKSNCRELITALGQRVYSPTRRCCIHRTPDSIRGETVALARQAQPRVCRRRVRLGKGVISTCRKYARRPAIKQGGAAWRALRQRFV